MTTLNKISFISFSIICILTFYVCCKTTLVQSYSAEKQADYVGTKICLTCHEGFDTVLQKTKHNIMFKNLEKTGAKNGCESCHGPASLHIDNPGEEIVKFGKLKPTETAAVCLKCHANSPKIKFWTISTHSKEDKTCTTCHKIHYVRAQNFVPLLLKEKQPEICFNCHQTRRGDIALPSRHPVKEKKVVCSDCHNPHSTLDIEYPGSSATSKCISCHQEKIGPFKYEHEPVAENCLACHSPHGSVNKKLLTFKEPSLCLQCHADALSIPMGANNTAQLKNCTTSSCHTSIHGSNNNLRFLR